MTYFLIKVPNAVKNTLKVVTQATTTATATKLETLCTIHGQCHTAVTKLVIKKRHAVTVVCSCVIQVRVHHAQKWSPTADTVQNQTQFQDVVRINTGRAIRNAIIYSAVSSIIALKSAIPVRVPIARKLAFNFANAKSQKRSSVHRNYLAVRRCLQ